MPYFFILSIKKKYIFLSFITVTFMFESMSIANAIKQFTDVIFKLFFYHFIETINGENLAKKGRE